MIPFKFFKGKVYTDEYTIPYGMSHRHWNILPQDLRGSTLQEMECYIQGWEGARNNIAVNPYHDIIRRELWNRGYWRFMNRTVQNFRNVNPNAAYAANRRGRTVAGIVTAKEEIKLVPNLFSVKTVVYELRSQSCENGLRNTSHQPLVWASPLARNEVINNPTVGISHNAAKMTSTTNEPRLFVFPFE